MATPQQSRASVLLDVAYLSRECDPWWYRRLRWLGVDAESAWSTLERHRKGLAYSCGQYGWHSRESSDYRGWMRRDRLRLCFLAARRAVRLVFWRG